MGQTTKIDWCDSSWNPVTGCKHECPYCYARGIASRFGGRWDEKTLRNRGCDGAIHVLDKPVMRHTTGKNRDKGVHNVIAPYPYGFDPTLHCYKLDEPQHWKKPRTIFVCSMADLFGEWVPDEWIQEVFEACRRAPQHRYLFLTKAPERLVKLGLNDQLPTEDNFWFGSSAPTPETPYFYSGRFNSFASIEPLLKPFHDIGAEDKRLLPGWIIIGAETGNRKGKVVPEKEWVDEIAMYAIGNGVPVFMKESLREIMGDDFRQDFPWTKGGSDGKSE